MKQGDIYVVDLDPTKGREQAGKRHVLVVSQKPFNDLTGHPVVAPITQGGSFAREAGFTVSLSGLGLKTQGVVLCHQLRVLDMKARAGKRVESLPEAILQEVIDRIVPIFEG
ncbi:type II toxin-antitoxin system PemK/MazF family toxin [Granulicella cerasi]|uniref:Type II toxin-antitoxin system PemK/MazF family toxin n=1 Tax=Granulicella cerasi TaxID=741063 RepID=A0ABW1ZAM6_9BACT|nr:type II toxin-antitoxin system PemK/MazF family toxin [Granulicella cerasi]